jgi:hypothetical protein
MYAAKPETATATLSSGSEHKWLVSDTTDTPVVDKPADENAHAGHQSNRQYLWIKIFYAASSVAVVSSGRSTSLPFSNFAPAEFFKADESSGC